MKCRAGLVVLDDNIGGDTEVRLISTGSGDGICGLHGPKEGLR